MLSFPVNGAKSASPLLSTYAIGRCDKCIKVSYPAYLGKRVT